MSKTTGNVLAEYEDDVKKSLSGFSDNPQYKIRLYQMAMSVANNYQLAECVPSTIAEALINGLSLGLDPNPALGQIHLIPYGRRCSLMVGYKGWVQLAAKNGITLWGDVIRENDDYEYIMGSKPELKHCPSIHPNDDRGDVIASYCCWVKNDNPNIVIPEVVTKADIDKARAMASAKSPAWNNWFERMAIKVAINRAANTMPMTVEMGQALSYDYKFNDEMSDNAKPINVKVIEPEPDQKKEIENKKEIEPEPKKIEEKKPEIKKQKPQPTASKPVKAGDQMALLETIDAIINVGVKWNEISIKMRDAMHVNNPGLDFTKDKLSYLKEEDAQKLLNWLNNYNGSEKHISIRKQNNKKPDETKGVRTDIDLSDL